MGQIVDLETWRRGRTPRAGRLGAIERAGNEPADVARLEAAVSRLHPLVARALEGEGRLRANVETELLAIMGELAVGLVAEAARRAERLAGRMAAGSPGRR